MPSYTVNPRFNLITTRNTFCSLMSVGIFLAIFASFLVGGEASADLNTIPPIETKTKQIRETKIENLVVKARMAISQKRLMTPVKKNAVYYLEQLQLLAPTDKRRLKILAEISDVYVDLAYKKMEINDLDQAQNYYNLAVEVMRKTKVDLNNEKLDNLQSEIDLRKEMIKELKLALKKQMDVGHAITQDKARISKPSLVDESQVTKRKVNNFIKRMAITTKEEIPKLSPNEQNQIVVIVNKQNNVSSLTMNELKSLYTGDKKNWSNGEKVILYLPPSESEANLWLARNVLLKTSSMGVIQFYMEGLNKYHFSKIPISPINSVLQVSRMTGGIGIVKAKETSGYNSVKIISIKEN